MVLRERRYNRGCRPERALSGGVKHHGALYDLCGAALGQSGAGA